MCLWACLSCPVPLLSPHCLFAYPHHSAPVGLPIGLVYVGTWSVTPDSAVPCGTHASAWYHLPPWVFPLCPSYSCSSLCAGSVLAH